MQLHINWIEQCAAARGIEDEFGMQKALAYLVGEKKVNHEHRELGERQAAPRGAERRRCADADQASEGQRVSESSLV
jgi:hypothetical protein